MRVVTIAIMLASISTAYAETAEELRIHGEDLAKKGRYTEAIDAFKAAERKEHRPRHACLIGLAYERTQAYPQAEVYLAQCKAQATAADPLPEWAPEAFKVLDDALAQQKLLPVMVMATPSDAQIAVSSFAPDDTFTAQSIHLAPGKYTFTAHAPGYADRTQDVEITDKPAAVSFMLEHRVPEPGERHPSKVPWVVMGGGVALGLAGAIVHVFAFLPARNNLNDASKKPSQSEATAYYNDWSTKFDQRRDITIALYSAGAVALITGIILKETVYKNPETQIAITPTNGGAMLGLSWTH